MTVQDTLEEIIQDRYKFRNDFRQLLNKDRRTVVDYMEDFLGSEGTNTPDYILEELLRSYNRNLMQSAVQIKVQKALEDQRNIRQTIENMGRKDPSAVGTVIEARLSSSSLRVQRDIIAGLRNVYQLKNLRQDIVSHYLDDIITNQHQFHSNCSSLYNSARKAVESYLQDFLTSQGLAVPDYVLDFIFQRNISKVIQLAVEIKVRQALEDSYNLSRTINDMIRYAKRTVESILKDYLQTNARNISLDNIDEIIAVCKRNRLNKSLLEQSYKIKLERIRSGFSTSFDDVIEVAVQVAEYDRQTFENYLQDVLRDHRDRETAAEWIADNERNYNIRSSIVRDAQRILEK